MKACYVCARVFTTTRQAGFDEEKVEVQHKMWLRWDCWSAVKVQYV